MNGMLLAAGRGTRMEPLSSLLAKPTLEVLGRPLLTSALGHLRAAGCGRLVVNLHRHAEQVAVAVRAAVGQCEEVLLSRERDLLGGAGGVAQARPLLGPGQVLVANADVWAALDLTALLGNPDDDGIALALLPHPDPGRWSSVELDGVGRVARLLPAGAEPCPTPYLFTGFQLVGANVLAALPPPPAEWQPLWLELRDRGALRGAVVSGRWREAGTPADYHDLVLAELGERAWVHAGATVGAGATLERSAVGAGCAIERAAAVIESVVTAGATVGRGCRIAHCVVAGPVHIASGDALADTLVLPDRRVPLPAR